MRVIPCIRQTDTLLKILDFADKALALSKVMSEYRLEIRDSGISSEPVRIEEMNEHVKRDT